MIDSPYLWILFEYSSEWKLTYAIHPEFFSFTQIIMKIYADETKTWHIVAIHLILITIPCLFFIAHMHLIAKPFILRLIFTAFIAAVIGL